MSHGLAWLNSKYACICVCVCVDWSRSFWAMRLTEVWSVNLCAILNTHEAGRRVALAGAPHIDMVYKYENS